MPEYTWVPPPVARYRNVATGQFVARETVIAWAEQSIALAEVASAAAVELLAAQAVNVADWQLLMRQALKDEYIRQYVLGKGGLGNMTPADWGSIGGMLGEQYRYLDRFAAEIAAGNLSPAQIQARADMYFESAREAYWRGYGRGLGMPDLPAYPGDGSTECLTRCACHWDIIEVEPGLWECTWVLNPFVENCPTCLERAQQWRPYVLEGR